MHPARSNRWDDARTAALYAAAALWLLAFHVVGFEFAGGYALDLGSVNFPTSGYVTFVAAWAFCGGVAALLLALALARTFGRDDRLPRAVQWSATPPTRFLLWACAAGFLIPVLTRFFVLQGAPVTDDEGAYRFAAELLATGRLWVPSPPLKLFFDQNFMINDGRLYPVYFLGWPAILAAGVLTHTADLVNPVLSALSVPAIYRVTRHYLTERWARAAVVVFLASPFVEVTAATQLSHTSCLLMLAWCWVYFLRTQADDASWHAHAAFAGTFACAVFIRPQTAVALNGPLLSAWAWSLRGRASRARRVAFIAFAVPAAAIALLFLLSLWAQNGSPWTVGYARYARYVVANGHRFSGFKAEDFTTIAGFDFSQVVPAIARTAAALFRLNFDLFGWPSSLVLMLAAMPVTHPRTRTAWSMVATFLLLMVFQRDWGIDTFGPVHAFELVLPILVLTMAGARDVGERLVWRRESAWPSWEWSVAGACLVAAFTATAWVGFVPVRLEALRRIASHINVALQAPEQRGIHNAVIFAPHPFAPPCGGVPKHWVFFRPVNDPDLRNDVIWVNQLDVHAESALLAHFPDRAGYVMTWTPQCTVTLAPFSPGMQ